MLFLGCWTAKKRINQTKGYLRASRAIFFDLSVQRLSARFACSEIHFFIDFFVFKYSSQFFLIKKLQNISKMSKSNKKKRADNICTERSTKSRFFRARSAPLTLVLKGHCFMVKYGVLNSEVVRPRAPRPLKNISLSTL